MANSNKKDTNNGAVIEKDLDKVLDEVAKETNVVPTVSVAQTEAIIQRQANLEFRKRDEKRRALVARYQNEEKVPVTISPFYAPYLGKVVRVSVNGIIVDIPADGKPYKINKTHADHVLAKIYKIDASIAHQRKLADVENNFEHAPGELHL